MSFDFDLLLVGGGLASGLLAYRLEALRPELKVAVLEQGPGLGGEHTWSFHAADLTEEAHRWVSPFVTRSWATHSVFFPAHQRRLLGPYHSVRSETFHNVLSAHLGDALRLNTRVEKLEPNRVTLADGSRLTAACVIDARGFSGVNRQRVGYQKFVGWDVELDKPHGLAGPILMDATCEQRDGFRFFYVLPWSETSVLIEDTRYSDTEDLDPPHFKSEIERYALRRGWQIQSWVREERGSLPIPLANVFSDRGQIASIQMRNSGVPAIGVRSGLFHPTTGYSFPDAVRIADALSAMPVLESRPLSRWMATFVEKENARRWFFRFLNRMLFQGARPDSRYRILERFYRLPEPLIARFYSAELTFRDYARILVGRPPIPITEAFHCVWEKEAALG